MTQPIIRVCKCIALLTLIAVGCGLASAGSTAFAPKAAEPAIVSKCKEDLARRFKLQVREITVVETQATTWPDTALGMPEIGKVYGRKKTSGWKIVLEARSCGYVYTASQRAFKYGGPVDLWLSSMLYTSSIQGEPNLTRDLYQCSLSGTNNVLLVTGVSDYYPQEKGAVIVKRRTSRSSHDLLYINALKAGQGKTLASAFDFGEAAINSTGDAWTGFIRSSVASAWSVVVARDGQDAANMQTLPLPDGVRPGHIAWSGDKIMIMVKNGDKTSCFTLSPKDDTPEWTASAVNTFPGLKSYMLNKSESLEIDQVNGTGKPNVEVARVWFTGDRNVIAKISDFTLRGYDFIDMRYAFIWGEKDGKAAAYTVDISTNEILPGFLGAGDNIKPFTCPPASAPYRIEPLKGLEK